MRDAWKWDNVELDFNDSWLGIKQTDRSSYYIWQNSFIAVCNFCDRTFSDCSTTRTTVSNSHWLSNCPHLGHLFSQTKAGIQTCITIKKNDDDRRAILKNAKQAPRKVMKGKEHSCCKKWKRIAASAKDQLDWSCEHKAKAGIFQNKTLWDNAAKMPLEACYKMYVKQCHPELAIVGMRILSPVISAS